MSARRRRATAAFDETIYLEFTMKVLGAAALLGLLLTGGVSLFERKANACVIQVYTGPEQCNCIVRDWGYSICATTGSGPCIVFGTCGGGPPIIFV